MIADQNRHNRWICISTALALLVAVLSSPLRHSNASDSFPRPDVLRRNYAIPSIPSATPSLKSITLRSTPVKTVRSENEEEDEEEKLVRAACPAWCSLGLPTSSSYPTTLTWAPATFGPAGASQPLRC